MRHRKLGPLDALWHIANFFAPAIGVAVLSASVAKLLWRHELKPVPWARLAGWAAAASAGVLVGGLALFGRDGKMATYGAMVLACAAALWWSGFVARRG